jgi:hypothetical protein
MEDLYYKKYLKYKKKYLLLKEQLGGENILKNMWQGTKKAASVTAGVSKYLAKKTGSVISAGISKGADIAHGVTTHGVGINYTKDADGRHLNFTTKGSVWEKSSEDLHQERKTKEFTNKCKEIKKLKLKNDINTKNKELKTKNEEKQHKITEAKELKQKIKTLKDDKIKCEKLISEHDKNVNALEQPKLENEKIIDKLKIEIDTIETELTQHTNDLKNINTDECKIGLV